MRIVFMGTPSMSARILEELARHHRIVGVFTRPDAVRGRGKSLVASPVKLKALELGCEVCTPSTLDDPDAIGELERMAPDAICVVAYGALLPKRVLDIPGYGCINVHASLLPRWRGAAPMQRAILSGDDTTGVSIMKMEEGLDTGAYCLQSEVLVGQSNLEELEGQLTSLGAQCLVDALAQIEAGTATWTAQAADGVTYAQKIEKSELLLDPESAAADNCARVRASSDAHPARASVCGRTLTVLDAVVPTDEAAQQACEQLRCGQAVYAQKRMLLRAGDGVLELKAVKPDGKKAMDAKSFASGLQGIKGKVFSWERV